MPEDALSSPASMTLAKACDTVRKTMRHPLQHTLTDNQTAMRQRPIAPSYRADLLFFALFLVVAVLVVYGIEQMSLPLSVLDVSPVTLDTHLLPAYALRTTLRMFVALGVSLLFTLVIATLAAKSRKAEQVIIPALDILQSVPVLGFLTFTVTFFMGLFPGSQLGVECAAIFAIFTSQAWNMTFSFFQSLRTVPHDLHEVSQQFGFSSWRRFVRLELPFAIPGLVWNMMMSMSGGWFFVVACEAITVGHTTVSLPGIGSWLALAIEQKNLYAILWAVVAMTIVIVLYDQLLFRPVVAWADKFRFEQTASQKRPRSWVYDLMRRTHLSTLIINAVCWPFHLLASLRLPPLPRRWHFPVQRTLLPDNGSAVAGCGGDKRHRRRCATGAVHRCITRFGRCTERYRYGVDYHGARRGADYHRKPHLAAGRRVDWFTSDGGRAPATAGPVFGCLPGECAVSFCGIFDCRLSPQPRCVAIAADGTGDAVVHLV